MQGWTPCPRACSAGWVRPTRSCSGWPPCSAPACSPSGRPPPRPPGRGCCWPSCSPGSSRPATPRPTADLAVAHPESGGGYVYGRERLAPARGAAGRGGVPGRQDVVGGRGRRGLRQPTCCPSQPLPAALAGDRGRHRAEHRRGALDGARGVRAGRRHARGAAGGRRGRALRVRRTVAVGHRGEPAGRAGAGAAAGCSACSPRPVWSSSPSPATPGSRRSARRCATRSRTLRRAIAIALGVTLVTYLLVAVGAAGRARHRAAGHRGRRRSSRWSTPAGRERARRAGPGRARRSRRARRCCRCWSGSAAPRWPWPAAASCRAALAVIGSARHPVPGRPRGRARRDRHRRAGRPGRGDRAVGLLGARLLRGDQPGRAAAAGGGAQLAAVDVGARPAACACGLAVLLPHPAGADHRGRPRRRLAALHRARPAAADAATVGGVVVLACAWPTSSPARCTTGTSRSAPPSARSGAGRCRSPTRPARWPSTPRCARPSASSTSATWASSRSPGRARRRSSTAASPPTWRRSAPGQAQYTLCCTETAGVVDDIIVYLVGPDEVLAVPNAANAARVAELLRAAAPDGVDGHRPAPRARRARRAGPAGRRRCSSPCCPGLPTSPAWTTWPSPTSAAIRVCRTGYTGERGYELLVPADDAPARVGRAARGGGAAGRRPGRARRP